MDGKDKGKDPEFLARRQRVREKRKHFGRAGFYAMVRPGPLVDKPDKPDKPDEPNKPNK